MKDEKWILALAVIATVLFAFSYSVNSKYPLSQYLNKTYYTSDTFRFVVPVTLEFSGESYDKNIYGDEPRGREHVSVLRPLYPFINSLLYRLTRDMDTSLTIIAFAAFLLLATGSFVSGRSLGLDAKYSALMSVIIISNASVLVNASLFMTDPLMLAFGVLLTGVFWKFYHDEFTVGRGIIISLLSFVFLLIKEHSLVFFSVPLVLYLKTRRKECLIFSVVVPVLAMGTWIVAHNFDYTLISEFYSYVTLNRGCPDCDVSIYQRIIAILGVVYGSVLFFPAGIMSERDKMRMHSILALVIVTLLLTSTGYIGSIRRYYYTLLLPVTFYGMLGLKRILAKMKIRDEVALPALAVLNVLIAVLVITEKYRGVSGSQY